MFKGRKSILYICIVTLFILGGFNVANAAIRDTINFQGKVQNSDGTNVADQAYNFEFKIYQGTTLKWTESWTNAALFTETGAITFTNDGCVAGVDSVVYTNDGNEAVLAAGQRLWNITKEESAIIYSVNTGTNTICVYDTPSATWAATDDITNRIYIKDGIFAVELNSLCNSWTGACAAAGGVSFSSDDLWLTVNFNADGEMKPRKRLTSVPYAQNALNVIGTGLIDLDSSTTGSSAILSVTQTGDGKLVEIIAGEGDNLALDVTGTVAISEAALGVASKVADDILFRPMFDNQSLTGTRGQLATYTDDTDNIPTFNLVQDTANRAPGGRSFTVGDGTDNETLYYPTSGNIDSDDGTISLWYSPSYASTEAGTKYLFHTDNHLRVLYDGADDKFYCQAYNGADWTTAQVTSAAQVFSSLDWLHILCTFDNDADPNLKLYINNIQTTDNDNWAAQALPTNFYVGSDKDGNNQSKGKIADFTIFNRVLTQQEAQQIYYLKRPIEDYAHTTTPYARTVTVGKYGADYTTIQAAINALYTAGCSVTLPCKIQVMPGVYTEQVTMREYIDIIGSGWEVTKITYNANPTLYAEDNSRLENITVEQTLAGSYSIYATNVAAADSFYADNIKLTGKRGIRYGYATLSNCEISGLTDVGIEEINGKIYDCRIFTPQYGIYLANKTLNIYNSTVSGTDYAVYGITAGGVLNAYNTSFTATSYGFYNDTAAVTVNSYNSTFSGGTADILLNNAGTVFSSYGDIFDSTKLVRTAGTFTRKSEPKNVVTVSKGYGGDYDTITEALNSLTTCSSGNQCKILVMPGTYTEQITMKEYVDIIGSGWEVTKITTATSPTVAAEDNSRIEGFTIEGTADTGHTAIYTFNVAAADSFYADNIKISVNAAGTDYAIDGNGGYGTISDCEINAGDFGISNGNFKIYNCQIVMSSGSGLRPFGRTISIYNSQVSGGTNGVILQTASSAINAYNTTFSGSSYGLYNDTAAGTINSYNSTYSGGTADILINNAGTVFNSYKDNFDTLTRTAGTFNQKDYARSDAVTALTVSQASTGDVVEISTSSTGLALDVTSGSVQLAEAALGVASKVAEDILFRPMWDNKSLTGTRGQPPTFTRADATPAAVSSTYLGDADTILDMPADDTNTPRFEKVESGGAGGRGVWIEEARTNYVDYSSFEAGDPPTGWSVQGGSNVGRSTVQVKHGTYAGNASYDASDWNVFQDVAGLSAGTTYRGSVWVYLASGGVDLSLYDGGGWSNVVRSSCNTTTNQWIRIEVSKVAPAGNSIRFGVRSCNGVSSAYIDAVQLEAGTFATTYIPTSDATDVVRAAETLTYPTSGNVKETDGSISMWVKPDWNGNDGLGHAFLNINTIGSDNALWFYKGSDNVLAAALSGSGFDEATQSVSSWVAGGWHHIVMTWGSSVVKLYVDGSKASDEGSITGTPVFPATIYVGSRADGALVANSLLSDLTIFNRALTQQEVLQLYNLKQPVTDYAHTTTPYADTVTVSKFGGDFTTITAALNYFGTKCTASRLCKIEVKPGTYTEQVTMKEYIDIIGSGWETTKITQGALNPTLYAKDNSRIENITIENTKADSVVVSGTNVVSDDSSYFRNVKIIGNGANNWGVGYGRLTIIDSEVKAGQYVFMTATNFKIYNSRISGYAAGAMGIAYGGTYNIYNSQFSGNLASAIYAQSGTSTINCYDSTFTGSTYGLNNTADGIAAVTSYGCTYSGGTADILINHASSAFNSYGDTFDSSKLVRTAGTFTRKSEPKNVVTVSKGYGGDYDTITEALDSFASTCTSSNQCTIKVMPGTYTEQVTMKEYIDIIGSGWEVTKITQVDAVAVTTANNSRLEGLEVSVTGCTDNNYGFISINGTSPVINKVKVSGNTTFGAFIKSYGTNPQPMLTNIETSGTGYADIFPSTGTTTLMYSYMHASVFGIMASGGNVNSSYNRFNNASADIYMNNPDSTVNSYKDSYLVVTQVNGTFNQKDYVRGDAVDALTITQSGTGKALSVYQTGVTGTDYGLYVTNTGAATTNVAGYFSASGAVTNNYGLIVEAGNVGIGTAAPQTKLHIQGTGNISQSFIRVSDSDVTTMFELSSDASGNAFVYIRDTSEVAKIMLNTAGNSFLNGGSVGIGDDTPDAHLDVSAADADNIVAMIIEQLDTGNIALDIDSASTTANILDVTGNALISGKGINVASTSTALSSGGLVSLDWSPGSAWTATGDLFSLNIGTNGTAANLLNIKDAGTSVFSVSETAITNNLPTSFTAAGDVSLAYDLKFTNQTSSYLKSLAPLYLEAGENFESNDLTLRTYNSGDLVVDAAGGVTLAQAQAWDIANGSTTSLNIESGLLNFDTTNSRVGIGTTAPGRTLSVSASSGYAGVNIVNTGAGGESFSFLVGNTVSGPAGTFGIYDEGEDWRFVIDTTGNVGIGNTGPTGLLDVNNTTTINIAVGANARILNVQGALTEAASGVHTRIAGVEITPPTITGGVATVTNTASLYISAAPTATVTGGNYALLVDAGDTVLDANLVVGGSTSRTETLDNAGFVMGGDDLFVAGMAGIEGNVYTDAAFIAGAGTTTYGNLSIESSGTLSINTSGNQAVTFGTGLATLGGDLAVNGATSADITSSTSAATIFNTTVTTLSLGGAATTLNVATTDGVTRAINIGTGTGADTINIGTGGTTADVITLGNAAVASTLTFNTGVSTTTGLTVNANLLSSGKGLYLASTSTALSSGNLLALDWSPGSATTATGDLFSLNIGTNGTVGNIFNLKDAGSSVFSVSETAITNALPTSFTAAGDVSMAYDLQFTNPSASFIKSYAPLYIEAGDPNQNHDLTLRASGSGTVIVNDTFLVQNTSNSVTAYQFQNAAGTTILDIDTTNSRVGIGTTAPAGSLHVLQNTTAGYAVYIRRDQATTDSPVFMIHQDNASDTQTAAIIRQDGTGNIFQLQDSLGIGVLTVKVGGSVGIGDDTPDAHFDLSAAAVDNVTAMLIEQLDTDQIALDIDASNTTANILDITGNALISGKGINVASTSTALTSGSLISLDWSPGSAWTATGDLFSLNIGTNGTVGNLLNIKDTGTSIFSVSETAVTTTIPLNVNVGGNVGFAYDIEFTDPDLSKIISTGTLSLEAGTPGRLQDLKLKTRGTGDIIADISNASAGIGGFKVLGSSGLVMTAGEPTIEFFRPIDVNVGGDVGFDYDLTFTNTGLASITSAGPLQVLAGDPNHAENLTLGTQGTGDVIVDIADSIFGMKVLGSSAGGYVMTLSPKGRLALAENITETGGILTVNQLDVTEAELPTLSVTADTGSCTSTTEYFYKVTAVNDNGETTASYESHVNTGGAGNNELVTVGWRPVTGAVKYRVFRETGTLVEDAEDLWTASANVTCTADSTYYKVGTYSAKEAIGAAFTTGLAAYETGIGAFDLSARPTMRLWIRSDLATEAGDLKIVTDETAACASPEESLDVPALAANTWYQVELAFATATTNRDAVICVGLVVNRDQGAQNIYIDDVAATTDNDSWIDGVYTNSPTTTLSDNCSGDTASTYPPTQNTTGGKVTVYRNQETSGIIETKTAFGVNEATVKIGQPLEVDVGGDVGFDYDLQFLNTGNSYITSAGPLTIMAGSPNVPHDLTLTTAGESPTTGGSIIVDIRYSNQTSGGFKVIGSDSGGFVFKISPAGDVEIGGTGSGGSDLTVKQNITITGGNITINKLDVTQAGTPSTSTTATGGSCLSATTYYYRVIAVNDNGETDVDTATSGSQLTGGAAENDEIVTVSWNPVSGATGYKLYRDIDDDWADAADNLVDGVTITSPTTTVIDNCSGDLASQTPNSTNTTGGDITGILSFSNATELTLSANVAGAVTITQTYHRIDTNADAATGDLATINGGLPGDILVLRAEHTDRTVVLKDGTGNLQLTGDITLDNTQDTAVLVYDGSNWLEAASSNSGADIAESYYVSDLSIGPGDVVSVAQTNAIENLQDEPKYFVQRSSSPYDSKIMGVVATAPGINLGGGYSKLPSGAETRQIALVGRTPVKVSLEAGNVGIGDFLTSSLTPGVAMKATGQGRIIGRALQPFSGLETDCQLSFVKSDNGKELTLKNCQQVSVETGKIMVLVNPGWLGAETVISDSAASSPTAQQQGITIFDRATGVAYCLYVENGALQTVPGICGNQPADEDEGASAPANPDGGTETEPVTETGPVDCGITSCDLDGTLHLMGVCHNSYIIGKCQTCTPSCVCTEGFSDCDNNMANGCETQSTFCI